LVVARQHDYALDAGCFEASNRFFGAGMNLVRDADLPDEHAVRGHEDAAAGVFWPDRAPSRGRRCREGSPAIHGCDYAAATQCFEVGGFGNLNAKTRGVLDDRLGERMGGSPIGRRSKA
jgi:hypothetical protein